MCIRDSVMARPVSTALLTSLRTATAVVETRPVPGPGCRYANGTVNSTDATGGGMTVSYTHLRAHETVLDLVCRLLLEKKNNNIP